MRRIGRTLQVAGIFTMLIASVRWVVFRFFELPKIPNDRPGDEGFWQGMPPFQYLMMALLIGAVITAVGAFLYDKARNRNPMV